MRINARLASAQVRELEWLKRTTHASTTEVIKAAIRVYYRELNKGQTEPGRLLREAGFVGCGEAEADLSQNYKDALGQDLATKHDHR